MEETKNLKTIIFIYKSNINNKRIFETGKIRICKSI